MPQELQSYQRASMNGFVTRAPSGGGGPPITLSNDPSVMVLNQTITKGGSGYSTLTLTGGVVKGLCRPNYVWVVDPWTTNAEIIVGPYDATGTTLNIGRPLQDQSPYVFQFNHSVNSLIAVFSQTEMNPTIYGALGDSVTDDWLALQRFILQVNNVYGGNTGHPADNLRYKIMRPIITQDWQFINELPLLVDTDFDPNCIQTNIISGNEYNPSQRAAALSLSESHYPFTVLGAGINMVINDPNAMSHMGPILRLTSVWARQLPTPLVEGRMYVVRSKVDNGDGTCTITLAEFATPTTAISFTGTGKGEAWCNWESQSHAFSDTLDIEVRVPDVCGYQPQRQNQPGRTRDLVVKCLASSGGETAATLAGDLSDNTNVNITLGVGGTKLGVEINGAANVYDSINVIGVSPGNVNAVGVDLGGKATYISRVYTELIGLGVNVGANDGSTIEMLAYKPMTGGIGAARDSGGISSDSTWAINKIQVVGNVFNVPLVVFPSVSGNPAVTFSSWDGVINSGVGDTDEHGVFPGIYHHASSGSFSGIVLPTRYSLAWIASSGTFKFRRIHEGLTYTSDSAGQVWLSNPTGISGMSHWIYKTSDSNAMTVKDYTGATTIATITTHGLYRFLFTNVWIQY